MKIRYHAVIKADVSIVYVFQHQASSEKDTELKGLRQLHSSSGCVGTVTARATRLSTTFHSLIHANGAPELDVAGSYALDLAEQQACKKDSIRQGQQQKMIVRKNL